MPKKSCALIGPGVGPKVQVGRKSRVTLKGAKPDEEICIRLFLKDGTEEEHNPQAVEIQMPECAYLQVEYRGNNKGFIACVLIGD